MRRFKAQMATRNNPALWILVLAAIVSCSGRDAFSADVATLRNGFSIRHESREYRGAITRLRLDANPANYVDVATADIVAIEKDDTPSQPVSPAGRAQSVDLNSAIAVASSRTLLDPDLISSIIHAESSFNPRALSPKGAQGLMQLMPGTAARLGVKNAFDPAANVDGGTRYFNELLESYHNDMAKALAAYNAGPQRVAQYHGIPPYHETRLYVARVIREFNNKKVAQKKPSRRPKAAAEKRAATRVSTPGS
jgi:soluble lytic murein transglycosylase-like protein